MGNSTISHLSPSNQTHSYILCLLLFCGRVFFSVSFVKCLSTLNILMIFSKLIRGRFSAVTTNCREIV